MAANGKFPNSMLAYLGWPEADHLRLVPTAAASITRLAAAFEAAFGKPLYLSDAYRTYDQQVRLKIQKGSFAAKPGTSVHGLGLAIDAASRINVDGSVEHRWMEANAGAFGWVNPAWAQDYNSNNGEHEPWHWEYHANLDRSNIIVPTTPTEKDWFDMATEAQLTAIVTASRPAEVVYFTKEGETNGAVYEAVLLERTYAHVPDENILKRRRDVLNAAGVKWIVWSSPVHEPLSLGKQVPWAD